MNTCENLHTYKHKGYNKLINEPIKENAKCDTIFKVLKTKIFKEYSCSVEILKDHNCHTILDGRRLKMDTSKICFKEDKKTQPWR